MSELLPITESEIKKIVEDAEMNIRKLETGILSAAIIQSYTSNKKLIRDSKKIMKLINEAERVKK